MLREVRHEHAALVTLHFAVLDRGVAKHLVQLDRLEGRDALLRLRASAKEV